MSRKPAISFLCSRHGEQAFAGFFVAAIRLACGCRWTNVHTRGLVWEQDNPRSGSKWHPVKQTLESDPFYHCPKCGNSVDIKPTFQLELTLKRARAHYELVEFRCSKCGTGWPA